MMSLPRNTTGAWSSRAGLRRVQSSLARSSAARSTADTQLDVALDLFYGPLYHRLLHGHLPLDEEFVEVVVDTVVRGLLVSE